MINVQDINNLATDVTRALLDVGLLTQAEAIADADTHHERAEAFYACAVPKGDRSVFLQKACGYLGAAYDHLSLRSPDAALAQARQAQAQLEGYKKEIA